MVTVPERYLLSLVLRGAVGSRHKSIHCIVRPVVSFAYHVIVYRVMALLDLNRLSFAVNRLALFVLVHCWELSDTTALATRFAACCCVATADLQRLHRSSIATDIVSSRPH